MASVLADRLARIYAAADEAFSVDPSGVRQSFTDRGGGRYMVGMDFDTALTKEQKVNQVQSVIYNTAHLRDHIKRSARSLGFEPSEVDDFVRGSDALQVVVDLSNSDKHGPAREGGWSGRNPELNGLAVAFVGGWQESDKGTLTVTIGPDLEQAIEVGGSGHFEIVGVVVDSAGSRIGGIRGLLKEALADWERFLADKTEPN